MISDFGFRCGSARYKTPHIKGERTTFDLGHLISRQQVTEKALTMNKWELEDRTKRFALRIIAFVANLPRRGIGDVIGYQLLKAGTSVGANYREANRRNQVMTSSIRSQSWKRKSRKAGIGWNWYTNPILVK